ncbi:MAG: hypothetical protein WAZ12_03865 [Candidatus Absconditicoccaceae bacterium]
MLLAFVLVIIVTGLAILSSIYSIFAPFVASFGDIVDYNVAYYGAISAVERGELVLKYKGPGFVGSGGWLDQDVFGKSSDTVLSGFSILLNDRNGMLWEINSRTNRIPNIGEGNVDKDLQLSGGNSNNYNKLDYKLVETILLSIDNSSIDDYYNSTGVYREDYSGSSISGQFRLSPKIFSGFGNSIAISNLCNNDSGLPEICDPDEDGLYDDIIVDWSLKGYHNGNQFLIMPNESVSYYGDENVVNTDQDTTIRKSNINNSSGIIFGNSKNIFNNSATNPNTQNVISTDVADISSKQFRDILSSSEYTGLQLKFVLVNFLRSFGDNIYPFLEYFFQFDSPIADRFYTIQGNGRKGDYDIKIIIKKPTFKETVAGSFTVIF